MTADWIRRALVRDLDGLAAQIAAYPNDAAVWQPVAGLTNTGGTLALHLAGNLRHFIGTHLGGTSYVRDREREFAARTVPRKEIAAEIAAARDEVDQALRRVTESDLGREFPLAVGGAKLTTGQLLVHLATHFAYHLGQLDYHRRAVTGAGSLPGMQSASVLLEVASAAR